MAKKSSKPESIKPEESNESEVNPESGSETVTTPYYEEWECKITRGRGENGKTVVTHEKLKLSRKRVRISEEQANILNTGFLSGENNTYGKMYFLPE